MKFVLLSQILFLSLLAPGLKDPPGPVLQASAPSPSQSRNQPSAAGSKEDLRPEAMNVFIQADERVFVTMAVARFANEDEAGSGSLWSTLARNLGNVDPELRSRVVGFWKRNFRAGPDKSVPLGGFIGLSLTLSDPPTLALPGRRLTLPEDVSEAARFLPLLREFYATSGLAKLVSPALRESVEPVAALRLQTTAMMFETLNYLHTFPILNLTRRSVLRSAESSIQDRPRVRVRRLFVIVNPLDSTDVAYVRNDILNGADRETDRLVGDDYFCVVGTSASIDPVRLAFLRFVLEPLSERHAEVCQKQAPVIGRLAERVLGAKAAESESAFSIINESLVRAVDARLRHRRVVAALGDITPKDRVEAEKLSDDDAMVELSSAYEKGAVLAFHFYDRLVRTEEVGADIGDYYEDMIRSIDVEREATRAASYRDARARVEARRAGAARKSDARGVSPLVERLGQVEALLKQGSLESAEEMIQELARLYPDNARVLFGQAEVRSHMAAKIDPSKSRDEDEAWERLMAQLEQAVQLYRRAVTTAVGPEDQWLISRAHVAIGKIFDFANQPEAAKLEYEKALAVGDVPGGAYRQARERLSGKESKEDPAAPPN